MRPVRQDLLRRWLWRSHRPRDLPPTTTSMPRALAQFSAAGLVALLVLATAGTTVLRRTGAAEAVREAGVLNSVQEQAIRPHLTDALVAGDRAAVADVDRAVRAMVLSGRVERIKVWAPDGHILYADDARLIGLRFRLGQDELDTLRTGHSVSGISDLSAPENRLEPAGHRLLEVYDRSHTPSGIPMLFESYLRYDSVLASGDRIWTDFAPALLLTLIALALLQLPLAWRLTRRLQQGQRERELLHARVVSASDAERRRIAADLHDGVVQTLAGVSYSLAAVAVQVGRSPTSTAGSAARTIANAAEQTRRGISELRTLLVDIYPPNLREVGLSGALGDLLGQLPAKGVQPELSIPASLELPAEVEALLYRAAQEAVRNVLTHAQAGRVEIAVHHEAGWALLDVHDDGRGFITTAKPAGSTHFGLRLLTETVGLLGGRLHVDSVPGLGTTLHLEVPAP